MNQTLLALLLYKCSVCEDYSMEKHVLLPLFFSSLFFLFNQVPFWLKTYIHCCKKMIYFVVAMEIQQGHKIKQHL